MFYLSARNTEPKGTTMNEYRGFRIYETTGQINAKPISADAGLVPIAARNLEELLPVIDFQYDEIERKAAELAAEKV